jgi:hypothetical protein
MKKIILITLLFCTALVQAQQTYWTYEKHFIDFTQKYEKIATLKSYALYAPAIRIRNNTNNEKTILMNLKTGVLGDYSVLFTGMVDKLKIFYDGKTEEKDAVLFDVGYSQDRKFIFLFPEGNKKFMDMLKISKTITIEMSTTEGIYYNHYNCTGFDEKIIEWEK